MSHPTRKHLTNIWLLLFIRQTRKFSFQHINRIIKIDSPYYPNVMPYAEAHTLREIGIGGRGYWTLQILKYKISTVEQQLMQICQILPATVF